MNQIIKLTSILYLHHLILLIIKDNKDLIIYNHVKKLPPMIF